MGTKINRNYFRNTDVVFIAKDLIGKVLCTYIGDQLTTGVISETEAYKGAEDKASHAYNNKRTKRTEIMFGEAGFAYVYLCYGIHKLFNIVTGPKEMPHAVLIRGIKPLDGIAIMEKRRNKKSSHKTFSAGPGTMSMALGIHMNCNAVDLEKNLIWLEDRKIDVPKHQIKTGPRIGIDYAEEHKDLPYRFLWS